MYQQMSNVSEFVRADGLSTSVRGYRDSGAGKGRSVALWSTQALLSALFVFAGVMKFVMPLQEMVRQSSLPGWFLLFIGVAEVMGGIGLILPALLRIRPFLTPIAASGLTIIMIGATALSLPMGPAALFPLVVGVLAGFVAYARWRMVPIPARVN